MTDADAALLEQWFAAAQVGLALYAADGSVLRENDELAEITGRDAAGLAAHPDVAPLVAQAAAGEVPGPLLLSHPDRPLDGASLSVLPVASKLGGAMVTLTAAPVSDDQVLHATLAMALEGAGAGSWVWHVDADAIHWSPSVGPMHGMERGAAPTAYAVWLRSLHPDDRGWVDAAIQDALADGEGYVLEFRVCTDEGEERWLHARGHVLRHPDGRPRAVAGLSTDITERKRREVAAQLLARAGLALAESLDAETTLQQIAELAVPTLADWCAVHVPGEDGSPTRVAVAQADPTRVAWAHSVEDRPQSGRGPQEVLRTGRSELHPSIDDAWLRETAVDGEHLALLRELDLSAVMVVPITARGRTLGAITFAQAESHRTYDEHDLQLGEELGRRAGLAMDNATLHRAEREANRRLRDLQAVTDVALTHLELDALLSELLERLGDVLRADV
ncbi:MAG TPA: PAS domain-containing protein, partial [Capillimicrobium sp.]